MTLVVVHFHHKQHNFINNFNYILSGSIKVFTTNFNPFYSFLGITYSPWQL